MVSILEKKAMQFQYWQPTTELPLVVKMARNKKILKTFQNIFTYEVAANYFFALQVIDWEGKKTHVGQHQFLCAKQHPQQFPCEPSDMQLKVDMIASAQSQSQSPIL